MVPNCIFLHLFHISRSTGFLKEKKIIKEERKRSKKHSIHKWNEGIKKQCWLVGASPQLVYLATNPISLLILAFAQRLCYFLERISLTPHVKQHPVFSLSIYSALHSISLHLFIVTLSPNKCKLHGGRIFALLFSTISQCLQSFWLLVNV